MQVTVLKNQVKKFNEKSNLNRPKDFCLLCAWVSIATLNLILGNAKYGYGQVNSSARSDLKFGFSIWQ